MSEPRPRKLSATRRAILAQLAAHGPTREASIASRTTGKAMHAAGLVIRSVQGVESRVSTMLEITPAGRAQLKPEDRCECRVCRGGVW